MIEASRGGVTRARILLLIRGEPLNTNQIAKRLGLNYRSVTHHINILVKNGLIMRIGKGYGSPFILTREAEEHWDIVYESICRILGEEKC